MLQSGELDAAFPAADMPIDDRTGSVVPLFPDGGREIMADFFARTGFLPVNHVVLVQRRLVDRHPWLPAALFEAFQAAKDEAYRRERRASGVFRDANGDMDWQSAHFGSDPFPYGYHRNRAMLELAAVQSQADGLTDQRLDVADLIAQDLLDT